MATIKSYSDLQQSKKLAKILPLESADMFYIAGKGEPIFIGNKMVAYGDDDYDALGEPDVLCWGLAALFGVLPKNLNIGRPSLESNYKGYYWIQYYDEFMKPNNYRTECFNNPVDACYEMIIKLHELKML